MVKEEVFGLKKDEEEEEDVYSDTDGDESEVEKEVGTEEEESEEEELNHGDEEGSEEEESEEQEDGGLGPFWGFVFKARDVVDDDTEDIIDEYVSKETKRTLKEKEEEEIEMYMDDEDQPETIGEMIKDVLDITDEFEQSGSCCFETCSRRTISSIGKMTELLLDNKESLQAHNPKMFETTYKLPNKRSGRKIGNRKVTTHRKRKFCRILKLEEVWVYQRLMPYCNVRTSVFV